MNLIQVGNRYPEYAIHRDHIACNVGEDGVLTIYVLLNGIDDNEKKQLSAETPLELMVYDKNNGVLVVLLKAGTLDWMDMFYIPANDKPSKRLGNALILHVFDSSDGTLVVNRMLGLTEDFAEDFKRRCKSQEWKSAFDSQRNVEKMLRNPTSFYVQNAVSACVIAGGAAVSETPIDE